MRLVFGDRGAGRGRRHLLALHRHDLVGYGTRIDRKAVNVCNASEARRAIQGSDQASSVLPSGHRDFAQRRKRDRALPQTAVLRV